MNAVRLHVESFGYLHGKPAGGDLTIDLRDRIRDPHVHPALRELTGLDAPVYRHVLATPGARDLIADVAQQVMALTRAQRRVRVLVGCQGGRHRSVVVAREVARLTGLFGVATEVAHHHVSRPAIRR
jgi:RNase adapter protein RapZ